jgi:ribosomal protein L23
MSTINVTINERANEYVFNINNDNEKHQISLKKALSDICEFNVNHQRSLFYIENSYKFKSKLSKTQRKELYSKLSFIYTMHFILKYVTTKIGYSIVEHDFKKYKELNDVEVLVHEK